MSIPTVKEMREAINKAGITERKVAKLEKQLAEAKADHAANVAVIQGGFVAPAEAEVAVSEEE